jgi:tetratricopeptide (TPR) repeat protein
VERVQREIEQQQIAPLESYNLIRGDVLARMERYDEAIEAFREEIRLFPSNLQTYANLALVYLVLDRQRDADRALEQMVRANPGERAVLFAARTLENLGDARGAERWRARARGM